SRWASAWARTSGHGWRQPSPAERAQRGRHARRVRTRPSLRAVPEPPGALAVRAVRTGAGEPPVPPCRHRYAAEAAGPVVLAGPEEPAAPGAAPAALRAR